MPWADLTLSGSTLYGMTGAGGTNDVGTIFSLAIAVPEPSIIALLLVGAAGVLGYAWRRAGRRDKGIKGSGVFTVPFVPRRARSKHVSQLLSAANAGWIQ
jgi:uncharacterized repeat protein (TIGR03803 family)